MSALLVEPPVRLISPTLLSRVSSALDDRGVAHGHLVEGAPNLNLNLSDQSRVFVKVTRPGDQRIRAFTEVAAASWASAHGFPCPTPLMDTPAIVTDENDEPRAVTAWSWVDTVSAGPLVDRARDVLAIIDRFTRTPPPVEAEPWKFDFLRQRIRDRLAQRNDTVVRALGLEAETLGERITDLMGGRTAHWSHLDLHLHNVGWRVNGKPVVFDWESSGIAPVEADLSQLLRSVFVDTPDYAPGERLRVASVIIAYADDRFDVDWRLVRALVRFRCISAASMFLVNGEKPMDLRRNLALLETPLDWLPRA